MRFITFMKRNYVNDNGPAGSLARSIKADGKNFPISRSHDLYRKYLEVYCSASDSILRAFYECFTKWKEQEKTWQKNRN